MSSDRWSIQKVEGGFIVEVGKPLDNPEGNMGPVYKFSQRVFTDSATLINFLHNELVGSN